LVRIRDAERFPNVPKPDISAARMIRLPSWRIVELLVIARRFRCNFVLRGGQLFTESFEATGSTGVARGEAGLHRLSPRLALGRLMLPG
jgi:hypothetical protein